MSLLGLAPFDRRGHQRRLIVDALRRAGTASRAELADLIGLSPQMVTSLVDDLLADGLVREIGRRATARGQPPIDLMLDPEGGFAVGIHVEPGRITGLVVDLTACIRAQASRACRTDNPQIALPAVARLVADLVDQADVARDRLWGVGVVVPGPFGDMDDVASDPLAMPAWSGGRFADDFAAALDTPVIVGNDATAAAIGEHLIGQARDLQHFIYVYVGEGIGGGLFVDGRPAVGAHGNAGEIGRFLVASPDHPGQLVKLESLASLDALRHMAAAAGHQDAAVLHAEALLARDPTVTERWLGQAAASLRVVIANLENLLDPDAIVLGGPLPKPALVRLATRIAPLLPSVSCTAGRSRPRLVIGASGRKSPALGGATLPLFRALSPQPRAARAPAAPQLLEVAS